MSVQPHDIHVVWREVLWALYVCDGTVDPHDPGIQIAQDELAKILRACAGLSVYFRGFILTFFADHHWIVPAQARGALARLVTPFLHDEFTSPLLP